MKHFFCHYDHLGNTRVVYQAKWDTPSNQLAFELQGAYDYFPYGKLLRSFVGGNGQERYLTTQHERDEESISENNFGAGLDYRIGRMYDSDVARFTTIDPKANLFQEWSSFNYVLGNPVMLTDPDGECPTCITYLVEAITRASIALNRFAANEVRLAQHEMKTGKSMNITQATREGLAPNKMMSDAYKMVKPLSDNIAFNIGFGSKFEVNRNVNVDVSFKTGTEGSSIFLGTSIANIEAGVDNNGETKASANVANKNIYKTENVDTYESDVTIPMGPVFFNFKSNPQLIINTYNSQDFNEQQEDINSSYSPFQIY